mmetsp:Transcript_16571/g.28083  ORF Transcript_16571/g.28083 Transcript_16571/m.28083 type:complete len:212 (+) Transcript_16571:1123-1758(+)
MHAGPRTRGGQGHGAAASLVGITHAADVCGPCTLCGSQHLVEPCALSHLLLQLTRIVRRVLLEDFSLVGASLVQLHPLPSAALQSLCVAQNLLKLGITEGKALHMFPQKLQELCVLRGSKLQSQGLACLHGPLQVSWLRSAKRLRQVLPENHGLLDGFSCRPFHFGVCLPVTVHAALQQRGATFATIAAVFKKNRRGCPYFWSRSGPDQQA